MLQFCSLLHISYNVLMYISTKKVFNFQFSFASVAIPYMYFK